MNYKTLQYCAYSDDRMQEAVHLRSVIEKSMIEKAVVGLAREIIKSDCVDCGIEYDIAKQRTLHTFTVRVVTE